MNTACILDTFPIVKRKDDAQFHGDYRTKRVILEIYNALAVSMQTGKAYQTRLDPPPADPKCCHSLIQKYEFKYDESSFKGSDL